MTRSACFITLEGLDGAGKSTHIPWIERRLRQAGVDLLSTREPGGTPLGESLRELLLHHPMDLRTETLLMFAARNEHWRTRILPALDRGQWVLCDRYTDASFAYQGGGRALGAEPVRVLEDWVQQGRGPDCTLLFDVPLEIARERLSRGREQADRFEREDAAFFERTRQAYHARAAAEPDRFRVLDARWSIEEIRAELDTILDGLLRTHGYASASSGQDRA
ncbi:MAG: dTMP kinase [Castellaniella sp.]|uniref:dTMP kinase n=1 Tax=Castellaniella sp. TaxID=1955812 RepID=UPI002A36FE48|nr:dTMP kinase [Castellaniella sp.]MDY0308182.1 dTMP kinase [Castellaniella sp.]